MWNPKRSLFVLLFLLSLVLPVFAQDDLSVLEELQKTALELSNKSNNSQEKLNNLRQNSKTELPNVNNSKANSEELNLESMNPFELLDQLEMKLNLAEANFLAATQYSKNLEGDLSNTKTELLNSKITLQNLKNALISNKEDTSAVVAELGKLYEKVKSLNEAISSYTKMQRRLRVTSYVEIGIGITCLGLGLAPIWKDEQKHIQNLLIGIGGATTASGIASFSMTINF